MNRFFITVFNSYHFNNSNCTLRRYKILQKRYRMRFSFKGAFNYDNTPFSGINPPSPHLTLYRIFVHILKEKSVISLFWWTPPISYHTLLRFFPIF